MFKTHLELNAAVEWDKLLIQRGTQLHHINPEVASEKLFIGKGKFKSQKNKKSNKWHILIEIFYHARLF